MREKLAKQYIKGTGIEIGGLHCPLPVSANVTYVDRLPPGEAHPDVKTKVPNVIIDDAEALINFESSSLDFIIANHVIEHCHDPIGTLKIWADRLKSNGIVYAAVPEKTQTFDKDRAVTKLGHLILDNEFGTYNDRDGEHYREWLSIIDKVQEPQLSERVVQCLKDRANIHFHCWDEPAQREFLNHIQSRRILQIVEIVPNGAEIIWILRKP